MGIRALNNPLAPYNAVWKQTGKGAASEAPVSPSPNPWTATGGTQSVDSGYMFHYFSSPGPNPFVVSNDPIPNANFILVAGGGSGAGGYGGGGGGGGLVYSNGAYEIATGTWTVTIGDGGPQAPTATPGNLTQRRGVSGSDSTFALPTAPVTITAKGGGGGRWTPDTSPWVPSTPPAGGSSGGGAGTPNLVQTATQPTQNPGIPTITNAGNAGGNAAGWPGPGGGGGGGAGGAGTDGPPTKAGDGGPGLGPPTWSWLPTSFFHNGYAAGGGGGSSYYGSGSSQPGDAPPDGTGGGGPSPVNSNGGAGQTNSGGGGAGANQPTPGQPAYQNQGGAGGSGAMVIAYPLG